ncbi:MAG: hypothetical protein KC547_19915 [Anaerolineae bacterium]|nr:hypothetical protein [Anaerolineae bacterium]MCA9907075.1 hypothetical protein [Anaerolineae bacterium]
MSLLKRLTPPGGTPPGPPPFPPRPGTPLGAIGARPNQRVIWEFTPLVDTIVYFDLAGILEEVYTLAELPLPVTPPAPVRNEPAPLTAPPGRPTLPGSRPSPFKPVPPPPPSPAHIFAATLEDNVAAEEALHQKLDVAWGDSPFTGAALIYGWRPEVKVALVARFQAIEQPPVIWRATDPLLVLNVLSRARTHVLLGNAPPALERGFLDRTLYTDDQRIVELAQASGIVEIPLVDPPVVEEEEAPEE